MVPASESRGGVQGRRFFGACFHGLGKYRLPPLGRRALRRHRRDAPVLRGIASSRPTLRFSGSRPGRRPPFVPSQPPGDRYLDSAHGLARGDG
jgi:hypothetical protein